VEIAELLGFAEKREVLRDSLGLLPPRQFREEKVLDKVSEVKKLFKTMIFSLNKKVRRNCIDKVLTQWFPTGVPFTIPRGAAS